MSNHTIESYLLDDEGLQKLGHFMAANNMYNEVLSHLALMDINQDVLVKLKGFHSDKLNDMHSKDPLVSKDLAYLFSTEHPDILVKPAAIQDDSTNLNI